MKKAFQLYNDQREDFDSLSDEEAGKLIKMVFAYVNGESIEEEDRLIRFAFQGIKRQLDRDYEKYLDRVEKNRNNAKARWEQEKSDGMRSHANGSDRMRSDAKNADKDKGKDKEKDKGKDIEKKKKEKMPAQEEFLKYAQEKAKELGYEWNATKVKSKYFAWKEAGWKDGKGNLIKNWKSKILNTLPYLLNEAAAKKATNKGWPQG